MPLSRKLLSSNVILFIPRYLLSFWPNLHRVAEPNGGSSTSMDLLNQFIRVSRGVAEAKRRIVAKYGTQEVRDLLPAELMDFLLRRA